jgi:tetratricopeptide (TPR) repeat protein
MEELEARMLTRAFLDVFPDATAWESMHPNEWILIGTQAPLRIDLSVLQERMSHPLVSQDMAKLGLQTPEDLLGLYMNGPEFLREFCGQAPPVTDDRTVVDFTNPRNPRSNFATAGEITRGVRSHAVSRRGLVTEVRVREFEQIYVWREPAADLIADFGQADPDSVRARIARVQDDRALRAARRNAIDVCALAQDYYVLGEVDRSFALLNENLDDFPAPANANIFAMRSLLLYRSGRPEEAKRDLDAALDIDSANGIAQSVVALLQQQAPAPP